ncbi:MAG: peptidylprolyl isomerase [Planctomycetota bacterium]
MIPAPLLLALAPALWQTPGPPGERVPGPVTAPPRKELLVDQLLAIVNDQVLTLSMVEKETKDKVEQFRIPENQVQILRTQIFQRMLLDLLFKEGFRQAKLDEKLLDRIVADEIDRNIREAGSLAAYTEELAQHNLTVDQQAKELRRFYASILFRQVEMGIIPAKGKGGFKATLAVRPSEIAAYYKKHLADYRREFRVSARLILLRDKDFPGGAEEARATLEKLRADIGNGRLDFAEAAEKHSAMRASTRGSLGWVDPEKTSLQKPIKEFLQKAAPGSMSEPLQVSGGWVLVLAEEVHPAGVAPLEEVQYEITGKLMVHTQNALLRETVARLRKRTYLWGPQVDEALDHAYQDPPETEKEGF